MATDQQRLTPEEIVVRLYDLRQARSGGMCLADALRSLGMSETTYYRWHKRFGDLLPGQAADLPRAARVRSKVTELEAANR